MDPVTGIQLFIAGLVLLMWGRSVHHYTECPSADRLTSAWGFVNSTRLVHTERAGTYAEGIVHCIRTDGTRYYIEPAQIIPIDACPANVTMDALIAGRKEIDKLCSSNELVEFVSGHPILKRANGSPLMFRLEGIVDAVQVQSADARKLVVSAALAYNMDTQREAIMAKDLWVASRVAGPNGSVVFHRVGSLFGRLGGRGLPGFAPTTEEPRNGRNGSALVIRTNPAVPDILVVALARSA